VISLDDVRAAASRLDGVVHRTPVITSRTLDERVGATVMLKPENLQRGGAFKLRGAYSMMSAQPPAELARGVVAVSSGNHAQAVAIAAGILGTSATIVMPEDTPPVKLESTRGYGAEIVPYDRYTQDRNALMAELAAERGALTVPPYDHPLVMAGQGTAALELFEDAGPVDVLVVPVGGGGLVAGCATVARALARDARVVGVEPEDGDDTRRSLAAGERVRIAVPRTIADGQQADIPGELTFDVVRERVDEVVLVSDAELVEAMRFALDRLKLVLEPSGASALAALLAGRVEVAGGRVGVVLSGGNVGAERLVRLVAGGEVVQPGQR
jgi:threonine dehydratase